MTIGILAFMVTVPSVRLLSMLRLANTYLSKPSLVIASFAKLLYNLITVDLIAPTFVIFLFAFVVVKILSFQSSPIGMHT